MIKNIEFKWNALQSEWCEFSWWIDVHNGNNITHFVYFCREHKLLVRVFFLMTKTTYVLKSLCFSTNMLFFKFVILLYTWYLKEAIKFYSRMYVFLKVFWWNCNQNHFFDGETPKIWGSWKVGITCVRRRQKISGVLVLVCTDVFFGRGQGKVGGQVDSEMLLRSKVEYFCTIKPVSAVCFYHVSYVFQTESTIFRCPWISRNSFLKTGRISEV